MTRRAMIPWMLAAGCDPDPDRVIPPYDDGVEVEGDCDDDGVIGTDVEALTEWYAIEEFNSVIQIDEETPGVGDIVRTEQGFADLLNELNITGPATANYVPYLPPVDFSSEQVGAVWLNVRRSCGIVIEGAHLRSKTDGSVVFDVTFLDTTKNCDQKCPDDVSQALAINSFDKDAPASVCRRINPGCPP